MKTRWFLESPVRQAAYQNGLLKWLIYFHDDDETYHIEINQKYRDCNWKKATVVEIDEKSGYIRFCVYNNGFPHFETQPLKMFFERFYKLCT